MTYMPTQPMPAYQPTPPARPRVHALALTSGILAGVAFLSALTHVTAFLTWLPAAGAIVFAIIALVKRATPRWLPLAAIIVAPLAWIIAIVVAISGIAILASSGGSDTPPAAVAPAVSLAPSPVATPTATPAPTPTPTPTEMATPEPTPEEVVAAPPTVPDDGSAALGSPLTNEDGVAMSVTFATCGVPYVGNEYFGETAIGQFCEVRLTVANGGTDAVDLSPYDFTGVIGAAEYEASNESTFGGESYFSTLNPGLATEAVVYFDMPVGATIEQVAYVPGWGILTTEMRFRTV